MAGAQCTKCGLSRADAAVRIQRCGEPACPLRAEPGANPRHAVALIVMFVVVIGLVGTGIALVVGRHNAADGGSPSSTRDEAAEHTAGSGGWIGRHAWLWESKPDAAPPPPAGPVASMIQPSFDCATARTAAAQFICGDAELAIADRNANLLFVQALARSRDPRALRRERATWLAGRAKLPADRAALLASYRDWAARLGS